ncbi:DNA recombination protein RmuC [Rhodobacterales bacterium HKCCE2091]|nr:DNA recombination protein RmuC [Rhodobacterales bacterium HKCCE2091]
MIQIGELRIDLTEPGVLIAVAVAAVLFLILWLSAHSALNRARALLRHDAGLREDHDRLRAEHAQAREDLAGLRIQAARMPELETLVSDLRADTLALNRQIEARNAEIAAMKQSHEARLEELRGLKAELETKFHSLASGVLETNSKAFLDRVSERFRVHAESAEADLAKRQQAIDSLVKPLAERLNLFEGHVKEIEKARNDAYGAIRTQVEQLAIGQQALGTETRKLVQALRAPKTRGRWGEMQLRQVFEMSGMTEHVDFVTEATHDTDAGRQRPDAIVRIPGGKSIVVDAKTPLEAYLDAMEADGPEAQGVQLRRHASQVRTHVKQLASKAYHEALNEAPDFVVMFIPGETFVSAAAEADPGLIEYAFENKVLIATPTTLMALIKAIAYGWQQEKMAENAVEVQKEAKELYSRLSTFGDHLGRVGKNLGTAVDSYNRAVGSLEGRVLPTARRFEAMGVVSPPEPISGPATVEQEPRKLSASEFVEPALADEAGSAAEDR